jgi:hypothetical protein
MATVSRMEDAIAIAIATHAPHRPFFQTRTSEHCNILFCLLIRSYKTKQLLLKSFFSAGGVPESDPATSMPTYSRSQTHTVVTSTRALDRL